MSALTPPERSNRARNLLFLTTPELWPLRPFLPLVRRRDNPDNPECGVLYDARGASGTWGYSATVFRTNLFELPESEAELLVLPKCVYDAPEELFDDGWQVD